MAQTIKHLGLYREMVLSKDDDLLALRVQMLLNLRNYP